MELKKIKYSSAPFFGFLALAMYLTTGVLQLALQARVPGYAETYGAVPAWQSLLLVPIVGGIVTYAIILAVICLYNKVAQKYPISWETKK